LPRVNRWRARKWQEHVSPSFAQRLPSLLVCWVSGLLCHQLTITRMGTIFFQVGHLTLLKLIPLDNVTKPIPTLAGLTLMYSSIFLRRDDYECRSNLPAHWSYMSTESSVAAPSLPGPSASCAPERASRWVRPRVNSGRKFSIRIHNWSSRNARNDRSNHSYNSVGRSSGVSRLFIKEKPLRFTAPVNLQGKHGMRSGTPFACRVGK
jgi:hypothetical protein